MTLEESEESMEKTYWNGEPCKAQVVIVIVGKSEKPTWWCADLEGQKREAVKIKYGEQTFFIDNEGDGSNDFPPGLGWRKVTVGKGSPCWNHQSLLVERVVKHLPRK